MIRATDGAPILLDFGASRFEIKQHSQLVSALVFKSGYSAPEQYTSNADRYGAWTDVYAFGATLYRAISGSRPTEATSRQLRDEQKPAALVAKARLSRQVPEGDRLGDEAVAGRPSAVDPRMAPIAARGQRARRPPARARCP